MVCKNRQWQQEPETPIEAPGMCEERDHGEAPERDAERYEPRDA